MIHIFSILHPSSNPLWGLQLKVTEKWKIFQDQVDDIVSMANCSIRNVATKQDDSKHISWFNNLSHRENAREEQDLQLLFRWIEAEEIRQHNVSISIVKKKCSRGEDHLLKGKVCSSQRPQGLRLGDSKQQIQRSVNLSRTLTNQHCYLYLVGYYTCQSKYYSTKYYMLKQSIHEYRAHAWGQSICIKYN